MCYGVHSLNNAIGVDSEFTILERIYRTGRGSAAAVRQRDLAHVAGVSLGMANSIVKRLALKGWVVVRRVNSRNVQYAVSPSGVREIARRSYRFIRRTIRDIAYYKEGLDRFCFEIRREGYATVVLEGASELDFILEHVCKQNGLEFRRSGSASHAAAGRSSARDVFVLVGEGSPRRREAARPGARAGRAFLKDILIGW